MIRTQRQILFFLSLVHLIHGGDWFCSVSQMETLMNEELKLLSLGREYVFKQEKLLQQMNTIVHNLDMMRKFIIKKNKRHLENPLRQFLLVKNLNSVDKFLESYLGNMKALLQSLVSSATSFPTLSDVDESARALLRLQRTYNLDARQLVRGIVRESKAVRALSTEECYEIANIACRDNDHHLCLSWAKAAYDGMVADDTNINREPLINLHNESLLKVEKLRKAESSERRTIEADFQDENEESTDELYQRLCREGSDPIEKYTLMHLKCYYWTNGHPFLRMNPMKMEELWLSPHIVRLYEVLSDNEMSEIISLAKPELQRATIRSAKATVEKSNLRVGKTAWLSHEYSDTISGITRRISLITGLSMKTAEDLQVANYGVGGHYEPHYDFNRKTHIKSHKVKMHGQRIATMLLYLTDVIHGGSTAFIDPQIVAEPIKGSAVFWYNFFPSGKMDLRTFHAACPVLVGVKWVANKWVHEFGQEFRRPCKLSANADNRIF